MSNAGEYNNVPAVKGTLRASAETIPQELAEFIREAAKSRAPIETDNLERRIEARPDPENGGWMVESRTLDPGEPEHPDSTQRNYDAYIEYGTRYMAAQPYMTPAAAAGLLKAQEIITDLGNKIDDAAQSGAVAL